MMNTDVLPWEGKIPTVGDKVILTERFFEHLDGEAVLKTANKPCTIESVSPIVLSEKGQHKQFYEIYVEETDYLVGINWKFYNAKTV